MTEVQSTLFSKFNEELEQLSKIDPLKEISSSTPQTLQVIAFHLMYEYLIEKWIDYRMNAGESVFKGIERIGFHNKIYIAKNAGMPGELFYALDFINNIRNKFAHQISKQELDAKELEKFVNIVDKIKDEGNWIDSISISENSRDFSYSTAKFNKERLYIALHALSFKARNFVFTTIYENNSTQIPRQNLA